MWEEDPRVQKKIALAYGSFVIAVTVARIVMAIPFRDAGMFMALLRGWQLFFVDLFYGSVVWEIALRRPYAYLPLRF